MSDTALPTIGFVERGIMGRPMARNLMAAGYGLTVLDIVPAAKDLKNALELARDAGVALPAAATVEQLMRAVEA